MPAISKWINMEKSPEEIQKLVVQLKEWILLQPQLPNDLTDHVVRRFLHSCYYDIDATKRTVETFFGIRASAPELISGRDPDSPQMQKTLKIVNLAQIKTSDNKNIWISQLNDPGLEQFDALQDARLFFMTVDAWILSNDHFADEDIAVMDVKDFTLKFITKFNISVARNLTKFQQEAMPIRLKAVHVVNAPPFIKILLNLTKPFIKKEMADMIHFHTPKSETLYDYISKENLPKDYGGTRPSMQEFMEETMKIITEQKKVFLNPNFWRIDKKEKGAAEAAAFKTLDID